LAESKKKTTKPRGKEPIVHLQLRLPKSMHDELRKMSFDTRRSQHEIVMEALTHYMEDQSR
jgi:predicted DNA-binding protein